MAAISFPSIGILTTSGFTESPQKNMIRTQMEHGFAKQAQRSAVNIVRRNVRYVFSEAEYATFKTFFYDTSSNGTSFFNWTDPVDNTSKDTRVVDGAFSATPLTGAWNHYQVTMQFETYE